MSEEPKPFPRCDLCGGPADESDCPEAARCRCGALATRYDPHNDGDAPLEFCERCHEKEALRLAVRAAKIGALDEAYGRMGKLVAECPPTPKITVEGQHYGIASCREVLCVMLKELMP